MTEFEKGVLVNTKNGDKLNTMSIAWGQIGIEWNKFVEGVSKIASVPKTDVWVFLNNLEGSDISEWGVILPESGCESEWFNSLPNELQEKLTVLAK